MKSRNSRIKTNFIQLLKDDSEEVLQALVPNISSMLETFIESQILDTEKVVSIKLLMMMIQI